MIRLKIVTPDGTGWEGEVDRVVVRGTEGDLAMMKSTAPIVTPLAIGHLRVFNEDGTQWEAAVTDGYVSMKNDVCTVATDAFEWASDIDVERARAAKERAEARLQEASHNDEIDYERAKFALKRAINRLSLKK